MANVTKPSGSRSIRPNPRSYLLRVTRYENVASLVIALLILVGMAVLIMFLLWLRSTILAAQVAVPVQLEQIGEGGGLGDSMEFEDVEEVGLETELEDPELMETLPTISDAVATKAAILEDPSLFDAEKTGRGGPKGDGRAPGSGGGRPGRPRRWEIVFDRGNTVETYARQLDFFRIWLGVPMADGRVVFAYNLAKDRPDTATKTYEEEKRMYLTWLGQGMQEADRELLAKADIDPGNRPILKFIEDEVAADLQTKEKAKAGPDKVDKVRATRFGVRAAGRGYEFYVIDQSYNY